MIHAKEMLEHLVTSLPAAGGGVKGKRSECRGRQDASLLCQAKRLPGTANGDYFGKGDGMWRIEGKCWSIR